MWPFRSGGGNNQAPEISLAELEARLGIKAPRAYVEYMTSLPAQKIKARGFDPKTLLVLNLELRESIPLDATPEKLFLTGDGSGNYYYVDLGDSSLKVLLWVHDPDAVEAIGQSLDDFLRQAAQESRIDRPVEPGQLHLCRTPHFAESILDPIGLEEWIEAVKSIPGLQYQGYREMTSPFSGQVTRFEAPGHAVALVDERPQPIHFGAGRATTQGNPQMRKIAQKLASKLNGRVRTG